MELQPNKGPSVAALKYQQIHITWSFSDECQVMDKDQFFSTSLSIFEPSMTTFF